MSSHSARVDLLRGQIAFASGSAATLRRCCSRRPSGSSRSTSSWPARPTWPRGARRSLAGHLAGAGDLLEVSRAARAAALCAGVLRARSTCCWTAWPLLVTDGRAAAAPTLRQARSAFADATSPVEEGLRWGWMAAGASAACGTTRAGTRDRRGRSSSPVTPARSTSCRSPLVALAMSDAWRGDFAAAASLIAEADAVAEATGSRIAPYAALFLAALRGNRGRGLRADRRRPSREAAAEGQGVAATTHSGRPRSCTTASAATTRRWRRPGRPASTPTSYVSIWALPELIEAAARTGDTSSRPTRSSGWRRRPSAGGTDCRRSGIEARCRALLSDGEAAETCTARRSTGWAGRRLRPELARAHLLYGEWLRRQGRRLDAREQLRTAHDLLAAIGMEAFAERARRELLATGESVRKRSVEARDQLTPQEAQIARLARDGRTNAEIGAQLFLSARTVEWHLRKVFAKLGIGSRRELHDALPLQRPDARPV